MRGRKKTGRNALALAFSMVTHLAVLTFLARQVEPHYVYPPPTGTPMDVQIVPMPKIAPIPPPPPPKKPPPPPKEKPVPKPAPPAPTPKAAPPAPQPARPAPPKPAPPRPAPAKPVPGKPIAALPASATRPAAKPATSLARAPTPAPARTAAPTSPSATPSPLNIHRPAMATPAGVPTLPMAPAAGPTGKPGSIASGSAASGAPNGSRLNGLNPYPTGAFPSGGTGLRGTLVGCANADRVKLSTVERTHCNQRFGESMSQAPILDGINPAKRAGFDRDAARQDRDRKYRDTTQTQESPTDIGGGIAHGPASSVIPIPH